MWILAPDHGQVEIEIFDRSDANLSDDQQEVAGQYMKLTSVAGTLPSGIALEFDLSFDVTTPVPDFIDNRYGPSCYFTAKPDKTYQRSCTVWADNINK